MALTLTPGVPLAPGGEAPPEPVKRKGKTAYFLLIPGMAWLVFFFVIPLGSLFLTSLERPLGSGPSAGYTSALRWQNYTEAISKYDTEFLRSFWYAGLATIVCLIISFPLAYFIAFRAGRWRNLLLVLIVAPFFCSFLIRTYAWKTILADDGFITTFANSLNLLPDDRILATPLAVVFGLVYNFLPFMVLPLYASLERIDPRLIEAAADLYARPWIGLQRVTIPLAMPGIVAGTLLTFIPATGDFINSQLLGSPRTRMIGNVIQTQFARDALPTAAALSFSLMAVILVVVFTYIRRAGTEELL